MFFNCRRPMALHAIFLLALCMCCTVISGQDHIYTTNEETGEGHYVGNIPQDLHLDPVASNLPPRTFKILNGGDKIRVDTASGDLATAIRLNRESLCPDNPSKCVIDVEVVVLPPVHFQLIKLQFVVEDLNDNEPQFPTQVISKEISESAHTGSIIRLDSAIDPDLGANSIREYRIASLPPGQEDSRGRSVPYFHLDIIRNIDGTKIPQLNLTRALDREKMASYSLLLYAVDGGTPALSGTATVQITVTDSNDNQPVFRQSEYIRDVPENQEPGSMIIQVQATDLDTGSNADIEYTFPSVVNAHDRALFHLNPQTGAIKIKEPGLDYENKTIHHLTVEARDRGPNPASAYTTVTVQVGDVNDEAPHIEVSFMDSIKVKPDKGDGGHKTVMVQEDIEKGTYLAFVTVTDRDTGNNGKVSCRIEQSSSFELEELDKDANRYLIRTKSELDREEKRLHNVEIVAWDQGSPSLKNMTTIVVELLDINDNPPAFPKRRYDVWVKENVRQGEQVTVLHADDPDAGKNAKITYSAKPATIDSVTPFVIHPLTGAVTFAMDAASLDAEKETKPFLMAVTATDNGDPRRNTTTLLSISISDENDNAPKFRKSSYDFRVKEDSKRGLYIGQVAADDDDVDKATNALITYSFVQEGTEANPFIVKRETGQIYFDGNSQSLDRERRNSLPYILTVEARDHGEEPQSARAVVEIYLEDVNDNAPEILHPNVTKDIAIVYMLGGDSPARKTKRAAPKTTSSATTNASVPTAKSKLQMMQELLLIGDSKSRQVRSPASLPVVVARIKARDADENENGRVHFSLDKGNTYGYFAVDVISGNVTLVPKDKASLRDMKRGCHVIGVIVKDQGTPVSMSTPTWVNIFITDATPGRVNLTDAMKDCQNNSFYPLLYAPKTNDPAHASSMSLLWIMIICFSAVLFILLIVMVIVLIKYKCRCGQSKQSRTYNCQQAGSPPPYSEGDVKMTNGTIDSRTSSYSDQWNGAQMQKGEMVMGVERFDGSMGSQTSARDSGTGDSVPNDPYNPNYRQQPYQRASQAYTTPHYQPTHVCLPQHEDGATDYAPGPMTDQHGYPVHPMPGRSDMVYTSRCTQECAMFGHGDNCWMPESLQRPPSRMTSFKAAEGYESDSLRMPQRAMSPSVYQRQAMDPQDFHNMRYTSAPSNTPYYYDPGSKFEAAGSGRSKFSTFRDDGTASDGGSTAHSNVSRQASVQSGYRQPAYPSAQPARVQSPMIINTASPTPYGAAARGKAYVNLQGGAFDGTQGVEDAHSNLSGSSSGHHPSYRGQHDYQPYPAGAYPAPYQQQQQQPMQSFVPTSQPHYADQQATYPAYPAEAAQDDFAATNLLLSPVDSEPGDYKQRLERQMQQQQQSYHQQQQQQPQQQGYKYRNGGSDEDDQHLLTEDGSEDPLSENAASTDKLSTIREELDPDEVVAQIDGLLL